MKYSRKSFAASSLAAFAGAAFPRFPAGAAEFSYKWAHDFPATHPINLRALEAAQRILQETGGRLDIHVFPANQLGGSAALLQQTRSGAIELLGNGYGSMETAVQAAGLATIPFAFAGHKEAAAAMDGPFGKFVRAAIERAGLHAFERTWDTGFRDVSNNVRPIRVPDDLKGLRIRVPASPTWVATFKALGASPVALDGSEMYVACQTHVVDGTDLPLASLDSYKMYEVQKYVSVTNQTWAGYAIVANPDAWQRLPGDVRDVVEKHVDAAGIADRADMVRLDATMERTLASKGMTVTHVDVSQFKAVVRASGLFSQLRSQYGGEGFDLLEKAVGKLT